MSQELYPSTKVVVYDCETTGYTKSDEVIQFSAIVMNDTLYTESLINFYCNTQVPISAGAFSTHGIDKARLFQLSEKKVFEDNWLEFIESLQGNNIVLVSWSQGGFDERLINQTLANNGLKDYFHFNYYRDLQKCMEQKESVFDLMGAVCHKIGRSRISLQAAATKLPYTKAQINHVYDGIAAQAPNVDFTQRYHNSLYDTFVTFLILNHYFGV